ncbi:MAG: CBS domain-containing protein [Bacteroidota bacterium]
MIAQDLISDSIPPVKSTDTLGNALDWMGEFKLNQLPVVDHRTFKGLITENDLLDAADLDAFVSDFQYVGWKSAYVHANQHIYELIQVMGNLKLELIPVLSEEEEYLGVVTLKDLLRHLGDQFAVQEPGSILVIQVPQNSYVLSEIGRIAESADAKILSFYLKVLPDEGSIQITIKVNVEDPNRVVAAFERFDYKVMETYRRRSSSDDARRNYNALMKYLDI